MKTKEKARLLYPKPMADVLGLVAYYMGLRSGDAESPCSPEAKKARIAQATNRGAKDSFPSDQFGGGVVFVLGAGCSMQYGLPGFYELLQEIDEDEDLPFGGGGATKDLRAAQEVIWSGLTTEAKQDVLARYLDKVPGRLSPGYWHLARFIARDKVRAVINLNFDDLLEDALESLGETPRVQDEIKFDSKGSGESKLLSLKDRPGTIYKLHGSIREQGGSPIISLAGTEFFKIPEQERALAQLLGENHVVILGYSCSDSDLRNALRQVGGRGRGFDSPDGSSSTEAAVQPGLAIHGPEAAGRDTEDPHRLFIFDVGDPNPQMVPLIRDRKSEYLSIRGPEAAFENVMVGLHLLARHGQKGLQTERDQPHAVLASRDDTSFMTQAEQEALANCLRMAFDIRARINVAEVSRIGIDSHAREIFRRCLQLARYAGNPLTSPEKYLLFCVSILHDLGYFEGYSRGEVARSRGWWFLNMHGSMTAELLTSYFRQDPKHLRSIYPETYGRTEDDLKEFQIALIDLCLCHPNTPEFDFTSATEAPAGVAEILRQGGSGQASEAPREDELSTAETLRCFLGQGGGAKALGRKSSGKDILWIEVLGVDVPVRLRLLHALFATVEELSSGHPFLPSTDPIQTSSSDDRLVIEDPVLDLYLRRKDQEVDFEIQRHRILAKKLKTSRPEAARWILEVAKQTVDDFREISIEYGGRGIGWELDPELDKLLERRLSGPRKVNKKEREKQESILAYLRSKGRGRYSSDQIAKYEREQMLRALDENRRASLALLSPGAKSRGPIDLRSEICDLVAIFSSKIPPNEGPADDRGARSSWNLTVFERRQLENEPRSPLDAKRSPELSVLISDLGAPGTLVGDKRTRVLEFLRRLGDPAANPEPLHHQATEKPARPLAAPPRRHLLWQYLQSVLAADSREIGIEFQECYESILYPAWRFTARKWREGIDAINMARASLDFGSTRFRGEVHIGIRHLFEHKIFWAKQDEKSEAKKAFGHGGCTLCTGRLLYVLAHLRLLDSTKELTKLEFGVEEHRLDTIAGGLLRFYLGRDPESECWWGIDCGEVDPSKKKPRGGKRARGSHGRKEPGIRSADYFAWAMRSLALVLAAHQRTFARPVEGKAKRGKEKNKGWLDKLGPGVSPTKVETLLARLWEVFCNPEGKDSGGHVVELVDVLMDPRAEEPHSYLIGEVSITLLLLFDLTGWPAKPGELGNRGIRFEFGKGNLERLIGGLETAINRLEGPKLSQLSRYYMLPARVVVHRYHSALDHDLSEIKTGSPDKKVDPTRQLVEETLDCSRSTVWITEGEDAGSWGYNTENTQRLASSLTEAWRYFLANQKVFAPVFDDLAG